MKTLKRVWEIKVKATVSFLKKLAVLILVIFLPSMRLSAQDMPDSMTAVGIQQLVNATINSLTNAGTTLLGNGSVAINGASSNLSALLNQFNTLVKDRLTDPIQKLSDNVRNLGNQLFSVCSRLNSILTQQQSCLLLNSQVIIASIQTITLELKNGIPIISNNSARLNYFQFDRHSPTIVPIEGGRINIVGFKLWPKNLQPIVNILDETRKKVIMKVIPERGKDDNTFSFILDSSEIIKFAGQSLQLQVEPFEKQLFFFSKSAGTCYLPIMIPLSFTSEVKIIAHAQYTFEKDTSSTLDYRPFYFDNSSCGNRINVNHTEAWSLPKDGVILSVTYKGPVDLNNDHNINVTQVGNTITAAGWIDAPTCFHFKIPPFGPTIDKLFKNSWWHALIAPVVGFKVEKIDQYTSESSFVKMTTPTTNILLNIPCNCEKPKTIVYWFDIVQKNGNVIKTIYSSPNSTTNSLADDWNGLSITAVLSETPINKSNQIALKLTQAQCGF